MKYKLIYDGGYYIDSFETEADTEEEAKRELKEIYDEWADDEQIDWKTTDDGVFVPTEVQVENWGFMILNCYCYLVPWDENTGAFSENEKDEIYLSDEELWKIGWREWEDIARPYTKGV